MTEHADADGEIQEIREILLEYCGNDQDSLDALAQLTIHYAISKHDHDIGPAGPLLLLSDAGIHEEHIGILYKTVCGEDIAKTAQFIESAALGEIDSSLLIAAIHNRQEIADIRLLKAVYEDGCHAEPH